MVASTRSCQPLARQISPDRHGFHSLDRLQIGWRFRQGAKFLAKFLQNRIPARVGVAIRLRLANQRELIDESEIRHMRNAAASEGDPPGISSMRGKVRGSAFTYSSGNAPAACT